MIEICYNLVDEIDEYGLPDIRRLVLPFTIGRPIKIHFTSIGDKTDIFIEIFRNNDFYKKDVFITEEMSDCFIGTEFDKCLTYHMPFEHINGIMKMGADEFAKQKYIIENNLQQYY